MNAIGIIESYWIHPTETSRIQWNSQWLWLRVLQRWPRVRWCLVRWCPIAAWVKSALRPELQEQKFAHKSQRVPSAGEWEIVRGALQIGFEHGHGSWPGYDQVAPKFVLESPLDQKGMRSLIHCNPYPMSIGEIHELNELRDFLPVNELSCAHLQPHFGRSSELLNPC